LPDLGGDIISGGVENFSGKGDDTLTQAYYNYLQSDVLCSFCCQ